MAAQWIIDKAAGKVTEDKNPYPDQEELSKVFVFMSFMVLNIVVNLLMAVYYSKPKPLGTMFA